MFNATKLDNLFHFDYSLRGSGPILPTVEVEAESFINENYASIFACVSVGIILGTVLGYKFFHPEHAAGYTEIE